MLWYNSYKKIYPNIILKNAKDGIYPCFYCGIKSNSIDHFIPQVFIDNIRSFIDISDSDRDIKEKIIKKQYIIPACRECNSLLSDGLFDTPNEKKSFLKAKLKKRYKKILYMPHWEIEEIEELGFMLKSVVKEGISLKDLIKKRIAW